MPRYKLKIRHHFKNIVRGELVLPSAGIYLLKGPVGSGKTSILRELYFHKNRKHTFSYQTLDFPFAAGIKALDHINMVKNSTSIDEAKLERFLLKFNIYNLLENEITKLSDGEKERLLISLALAERTPIVLLDEPSARLDRLSITRLVDLLAEEKNERLILISTHRNDFEQLSSGTYNIEDKKLIKPQEEIIEGKLKLIKRIPNKKRYPKSRLIQAFMLGITSILAAISISSLIPSMEYLSPSPDNFYFGPETKSTTRYQMKKCFLCLLDPLTSLDFYSVPPKLYYVYKETPYIFDITEFYGGKKIISFNEYRSQKNIYVESIDSVDFAISKGLFLLLSSVHVNFNERFFSLGGVSSPKVFEDKGVYIKYPESMIHNLMYMFRNGGIERYASPEDMFYDSHFRPVKLKNDQIALNINYYLESDDVTFGPNFPDSDELKDAVFFRGPRKLERIINKKYDYSFDQAQIYASNFATYSRSNAPDRIYERFYTTTDDFTVLKSAYLHQIKNTNLAISIYLPSSSMLFVLLTLCLSLIFESHLLGNQRDIYLFYNSHKSSFFRSLGLADLVVILTMIPALFFAIPLFIPAVTPTINFGLGFAWLMGIGLLLVLEKLLFSLIINFSRRARLR